MLDEPVLVLNRSWLPLQVANVRRIMRLLYRHHAYVVCPRSFRTFDFESWKSQSDELDGPFLHTPTFRIGVPEVVVLRKFNRTIRRHIRFSRKNIILRDQWTCQYCGRQFPERELTMEHVQPVSKGGPNTWENVVLACAQCNRHKANRTPAEAGMHLLREPRKPKVEFVTHPRLSTVRETWQPFLTQAAPAL
jgi:5-methylcytosine-specific restriction endonuclease McrA